MEMDCSVVDRSRAIAGRQRAFEKILPGQVTCDYFESKTDRACLL